MNIIKHAGKNFETFCEELIKLCHLIKRMGLSSKDLFITVVTTVLSCTLTAFKIKMTQIWTATNFPSNAYTWKTFLDMTTSFYVVTVIYESLKMCRHYKIYADPGGVLGLQQNWS